MSTNTSQEIVTINDWDACYNSSDKVIVVSCTVSAADAGQLITGVGLIINNAEGVTVASFYNGLSSGCEQVSPAFNLPIGPLNVGDSVWAVAQGQCGSQHFLVEQELTISDC
ncbi:MAG TPA: hypothetical protein VIT88_05955 [Pyrinomonadaceae bacterium]